MRLDRVVLALTDLARLETEHASLVRGRPPSRLGTEKRIVPLGGM